MGLVELCFIIVILGVGLYFVETYVPIAAPIKFLLRVVVIIGICYLILGWLGYVNIPFRR